MHRNPVGWFEIYVADMARAKAFYEAVLGVELSKLDNAMFDMLVFPGGLEQAGATGALVKGPEGCPIGLGGTLVYFSCGDCAIEEQRALANGAKIHQSKFSIGQYGYIALVYDTEGNLFGLHSMA